MFPVNMSTPHSMLAMDQTDKWLQQNCLNGSNDKNVQLTENITEKKEQFCSKLFYLSL